MNSNIHVFNYGMSSNVLIRSQEKRFLQYVCVKCHSRYLDVKLSLRSSNHDLILSRKQSIPLSLTFLCQASVDGLCVVFFSLTYEKAWAF